MTYKLKGAIILAYMTANCRRGYWWKSNTLAKNIMIYLIPIILCTSIIETAVYENCRQGGARGRKLVDS